MNDVRDHLLQQCQKVIPTLSDVAVMNTGEHHILTVRLRIISSHHTHLIYISLFSSRLLGHLYTDLSHLLRFPSEIGKTIKKDRDKILLNLSEIHALYWIM